MAGARTEQAGQQQPLGDGGVLVLVEEDHPELLAQQRAHLGPGGGELRGEGYLVAEVEQVAGAFGGAVAADELQQFEAAAHGLGDLTQVLVGEPGAGQHVQQRGVVEAQALRVDQVLGEFRVEREEVADQVGDGLGERGVRAGCVAQHLRGELEAGGVGEEAGAGLQADAQAVVLQELAGEGVVRGDARLPAGRGGVGRGGVGVGDAGPRQGGAYALGQFTGGLVGEGETEDLLGRDRAGADEPDHAGGHHGGLAGSGTGDDHLGGGRGGDAGHLFGRERDPEELFELLGIGQYGRTRGHVKRLAAPTDIPDRPAAQPPGLTRRSGGPPGGRCTSCGRTVSYTCV